MIFLLVILVLVVIAIVWLAKQPSEFVISRSLAIASTSEALFAEVNDLRRFNEWNPWAKIDANSVASFSGAQQGVSAELYWAGGKTTGEGKMTIVESRPHEYIQCRMDFLKPFKATNKAEFSFKKEGDATLVTWSMSGDNPPIRTLLNLVFNCDKMVGSQFEKGLSNLKAIVEK